MSPFRTAAHQDASASDNGRSAVASGGRELVASVEDLSVRFHTKRGVVRAVDGVSMSIAEGEILGLVGETGCGKSVTARSFLRLLQIPPAEFAGGRILFRARDRCTACGGSGCAVCGQRGWESTCLACAGRGCERCAETGRRMVDLLSIADDDMRAIRGDRIAMIFQDPVKALNPTMPVGRQIAEVFLQHRSEELLERAGIDLASLDPATRRVLLRAFQQRSRVPERVLLRVPWLRGRWGRIRASVDERVAEALAETRIPNPGKVMASYPHELSGGMNQRVMIAQALACDPDLLIADEPTTALDVTIQARILELIRELQEQHGAAILYITHDLSLVRGLCDRVNVMYAGRIAEAAETAELFQDPLHPYTRGLLAAMPAHGDGRGRLSAIDGSVQQVTDDAARCSFNPRCPHAGEVCRLRTPVLTPSGGPGHRVACFLHQELDGVEPESLPVREPRR